MVGEIWSPIANWHRCQRRTAATATTDAAANVFRRDPAGSSRSGAVSKYEKAGLKMLVAKMAVMMKKRQPAKKRLGRPRYPCRRGGRVRDGRGV